MLLNKNFWVNSWNYRKAFQSTVQQSNRTVNAPVANGLLLHLLTLPVQGGPERREKTRARARVAAAMPTEVKVQLRLPCQILSSDGLSAHWQPYLCAGELPFTPSVRHSPWQGDIMYDQWSWTRRSCLRGTNGVNTLRQTEN